MKPAHRILTKREKIIFVCTLTLAVLSIFYQLVLSGLFLHNEELTRQIESSRVKLAKYLMLLKQKEVIEQKLKNFDGSFSSGFGNSRDFRNSLFEEIENIARDSNAKIIDIRPQQELQKNSQLREFLTNVVIESDISGVVKFVYEIENSILLLKIKTFRIDATSSPKLVKTSLIISQLSAGE